MSGRTCGEFYREAIRQYTTDDATYWAFAAGFVHGQAEKVMLGACRAAMFRPSEDKAMALSAIVHEACERYGLTYRRWNDEFWIFRGDDGVSDELARLQAVERDSQRYHAIRADLCGVGIRQFDPEFHNRQGYGQPCDR